MKTGRQHIIRAAVIIILSSMCALSALSSDYLDQYSLDNEFQLELKEYFRKFDRRKLRRARVSNPIHIDPHYFIELLNQRHKKSMAEFKELKQVLDKILVQYERNEHIRGYQHHKIRRGYTAFVNSLFDTFKMMRNLIPKSTKVRDVFKKDKEFNQRMLWLYAHGVVVNDYLMLCDLVYYNTYTRLYINMMDMAYDIPRNHLDKMAKYLSRANELKYLKDLFKKFHKHQRRNHEDELSNLIYSNLKKLDYYQKIAYGDVVSGVSRPFARMIRVIRDSFQNAASNAGFGLSLVFGRVASNTKFRPYGYLSGNDEIREEIETYLQPLDVLTDKNYNRLSNYLITSHFGHAAIYLGTKEQLQEIEMWDHPVIEPFQKNIEKGQVILEAIPSGVRLSSLKKFLDTDEIGVFRYKKLNLNNSKLVERILFNGLIHVGKPYDYNFDTYTSGTLICSEVVFQAYDFIIWDTDYVMMRHMVTPDHIAQRVIDDHSDFDMVLYLTALSQTQIVQRDTDFLTQVLAEARDGKAYIPSEYESEVPHE